MRAVADDRDVDLDVLVDRRRIDIDVDLGRAGREGVEPAGDAIVEARADADHHVAIVHRPVRLPGAVHAEHAEPLRVGGGKCAKPHQGRGDREPGELDQFAQQVAGAAAGIDHAAATIKHRALGGRHHLHRALYCIGLALELRPIAAVMEFGRLEISALGELDVFGNIDHDRTGTAAGSDMERLMQHMRQIGDRFDQIIILSAGPGDADGVAFLKGVIADEMGRHLPGNGDQRHRVAQCVGQAGDRIGRARARRHQHRADLSGRARITLGGMHRALFVAH